jgi:hypothetical protein
MGQWIGQSTLLGHVSALGQSFWIIPLNDLGFFFFFIQLKLETLPETRVFVSNNIRNNILLFF